MTDGIKKKFILAGKGIEHVVRDLKKRLFMETALKTLPGSYRFRFLMALFTLRNVKKQRHVIQKIIQYKKVLNYPQNNITFVFNCFLSLSYDMLFPHLLVENPQKYLQYVSIEGEEYVRRLLDQDTGVILISGHFGPKFRAILFKEALGINTPSFIGPAYRDKIANSSSKLYKTLSLYKYYIVGEEKQLQEGLRKKEWIVFLNDYPVKKKESNNQTMFGKKVYFSELQFKISLEQNIPLLFFGTTRIKHKYQISILPLDNFQTKQEGLEKYVALVEGLLHRDPYAGFFTAEHHF